MNYEPPIQPDDTQPNQPSASRSTLPRRKWKAKALPLWLWLGLFVFTGISLIGSIALLFAGDSPEPNAESYSITLLLGSERRDLESSTATVGDLLEDENIV